MYASSSVLEAEMNRPLRRAPEAVIERTGMMVGRAVAGAAALFDTRLVLVSGTVPATFGTPFLDAVSRELDQRSRIGHLRSLPDRARPLVQVGVTALGREAALVGAAGLARLSLQQTARSTRRPPADAGASR